MAKALKVGRLALALVVLASASAAYADVLVRELSAVTDAPAIGTPLDGELSVGRNGFADLTVGAFAVRVHPDSKVRGANGALAILDGTLTAVGPVDKRLIISTPLGRAIIAGSGRLVVAQDVGAESLSVFMGRGALANTHGVVDLGQGSGAASTSMDAPSGPWPLPTPPEREREGVVTMVGESSAHARWLPQTDVVSVEVVVAPLSAPTRPALRWRTSQDLAPIPRLEPGVYFVSLTSVDDRGLVGPTGAPQPLVVLPATKRPDGVVLVARGARVAAPGPGTIEQPAPEGTELSLIGPSAFHRPGRYTVSYRLETEGRTFEGSYGVEVDVPKIAVPRPSVEVKRGVSTAKVRFRVRGSGGAPIVDQKFLARRAAPTAEVIVKVGSEGIHDHDGRFESCACKEVPLDAIPVDELGGGYYSFDVSRLAEDGAFEVVEVLSVQAGLRYSFPVPVGSPSDEVPVEVVTTTSAPAPDYPKGAFVSVRMGAQTATDDGADFWLGAEIGARIGVTETLFIDVGAQVAGIERSLQHVDGTRYRVGVYTLQAPASLGAAFGVWRPYLGFAAGARVIQLPEQPGSDVASDLQPAWTLSGGIGVALGPGEIVAEIGYGTSELDSDGLQGTLGGLNVLLGYRLMPNLSM